MSRYIIKNSSQTAGCISVGIVATALIFNFVVPEIEKKESINIKGSAYSSSAVPSTFDQFSNIYSGEFMPGSNLLVKEMSNFYARLLNQQEQLEPEFEFVLNENLWDLYES